MSIKIIDGFPSTSGDDYQLNVISFLKNAATTYPEVEVVSRKNNGDIFRYNYYEVFERVKRLANALEHLGAKAGDRIGVMDWNTYRHFELYNGIPGVGAVLLQLNPRLSPEDLAYVINHSKPKIIVAGETFLPLIELFADKVETVEKYIIVTDKDLNEIKTKLNQIYSYEELLKNEEPVYDWPMINEKSAYSACYTTGTTGRPKGVYYSHRCIYLHTMMISNQLGVNLKDTILQMVPMFHGQGWGLFFAALLTGAKLVFSGRYTAEATDVLVDLMISEKVTVSGGAPAIFMPMLEYIKSLPQKPDFTGLRMVSGATEPPLSMMRGYFDLGGAQIIHAYGATETTPLVLVNQFKPTLKGWTLEQQWDNQKNQGLLVAGLDMRVVDPDGNDIPHDGETVGELLVRGPWITTSYYDDKRTSEAFIDGYWKSGDVATVNENKYVKITDRIKDVIKSGGEWISSIDLENAIMAYDDISEAVVVGLEHDKWQERPLALVVLKENAIGRVKKEDILEFIKPGFAKWQLPDDIVFVKEIPKTSVGKFSKKDIRKEYKNYFTKK